MNPTLLFKKLIAKYWRRMAVVVNSTNLYFSIKTLLDPLEDTYQIEMNSVYTGVNILNLVMLFVSFKSKYEYSIISHCYIIIYIRNALRICDFEQSRNKMESDNWN